MLKSELRQEATGKWVVRDKRSGRFVEVRGADSMKSAQLQLENGVDLTKPIAEQVLTAHQPLPPEPGSKS